MHKLNGNDPSAREIQERVITVVCEISGLEPDELEMGMSIVDDIAPSSIDRVTLFMALEDEFGASIPESEVRDVTTIGELLDFVMSRIRESRALSA